MDDHFPYEIMSKPGARSGLRTKQLPQLRCVFFVYRGMSYIHTLGGGFKYLLFSPLLREMIQFDEYFWNGLKPPTRYLIPRPSTVPIGQLVVSKKGCADFHHAGQGKRLRLLPVKMVQ